VLSSMCYAVQVWSQPNRQSLSNRENASARNGMGERPCLRKMREGYGRIPTTLQAATSSGRLPHVIFDRMFGA
jgi:hypothetical protein